MDACPCPMPDHSFSNALGLTVKTIPGKDGSAVFQHLKIHTLNHSNQLALWNSLYVVRGGGRMITLMFLEVLEKIMFAKTLLSDPINFLNCFSNYYFYKFRLQRITCIYMSKSLRWNPNLDAHNNLLKLVIETLAYLLNYNLLQSCTIQNRSKRSLTI